LLLQLALFCLDCVPGSIVQELHDMSSASTAPLWADQRCGVLTVCRAAQLGQRPACN